MIFSPDHGVGRNKIGRREHTAIVYFSYHAVAKRLIREGKLIDFRRVERWGRISPAFVLFFTDHRPMPIREARVPEYAALIEECKGTRSPSE